VISEKVLAEALPEGDTMADRPPQPANNDNTKAQQRRRIWKLAGAGLLALGLLVILLLACVLWIPRSLYPSLTETDLRTVSDAGKLQELEDARLKLQNDARTTLLQGLGALLLLTGAGIGAAVTLRQVKVSQDGLRATREQMQHTLETTRQQINLAEQSQVTDRYTRAVEQLGHEQAPVRLGALYSLEHLAQDNPQYRQTVVDVFCAYPSHALTPPPRHESHEEQAEEAVPLAGDRDRGPHRAPARDPAQEELQVRLTAQRILADHLRPPWWIDSADAQGRPISPEETFWPRISLDLTGATLVNLDFKSVSIEWPRFEEATFYGAAGFNRAAFHGNAWFNRATFHHEAHFAGVTFHGNAEFDRVTFVGETWFGGTFQEAAFFDQATFQIIAKFSMATFESTADFSGATFHRDAEFNPTRFQSDAKFVATHFQGKAMFRQARFKGSAWFRRASFQGKAEFSHARFGSYATFEVARFEGIARFDSATLQGNVEFIGAQVLQDTPVLRSVWPDGYTIRPDPADPARGTLIPADLAAEPEPAAPPPDQTG
jgi:uncharacterized protein YjbI with pentapeptide repeats